LLEERELESGGTAEIGIGIKLIVVSLDSGKEYTLKKADQEEVEEEELKKHPKKGKEKPTRPGVSKKSTRNRERHLQKERVLKTLETTEARLKINSIGRTPPTSYSVPKNQSVLYISHPPLYSQSLPSSKQIICLTTYASFGAH
jgi:hypothetical protein